MTRTILFITLLFSFSIAFSQIDPDFILKPQLGSPIEKKHFTGKGYLSKLAPSLIKINADETGFNYMFKTAVNEAALAGAANEFFTLVHFNKELELTKEIPVDFGKDKVHYAYTGSFDNSTDLYLYFTAWDKTSKEYYICYAMVNKKNYEITYHDDGGLSFGKVKDTDVQNIADGRIVQSESGEFNFISAEMIFRGTKESTYDIYYILVDSMNNLISASKAEYTEPGTAFSPYKIKLDNKGNFYSLIQVQKPAGIKLESANIVYYKMLYIPAGSDKFYASTIEVKDMSISLVKLFTDENDKVYLSGLYVYPGTWNLKGFFEAELSEDGIFDGNDILSYEINPRLFAENNSDAGDVEKKKYISQDKVNNMIGWRIDDRIITDEKNCHYIILEERASANIEFYGSLLIAKIADEKLEWVRIIPKKSSTYLAANSYQIGYEAFASGDQLNLLYPDNPKNEGLGEKKESVPGLITQYNLYFSIIDTKGNITTKRGLSPDQIEGKYYYFLREKDFKESDNSYVGMFESKDNYLLVRLRK